MSFSLTWYNALSAIAFVLWTSKYLDRRRRNPQNLPLPPGPKGWPILGSFFENGAPLPWLQYSRWTKQYGDVVYFEVMGQPFIILGSLKAVNDLIEKRSKNYSDRMWLTMTMDLMEWGFNLALLPYGDAWRRRRRQFHEHFNANAVHKYVPIQVDEVKTFLNNLLEDRNPDNLVPYIRRTFAATIMRTVYSIPVTSNDNEYIARAEAALEGAAEAAVPGAFLVDFIPILKYVPAWFPGAGFQKKAAVWKQINHDVCEIPFAVVTEQLRNKTAPPSIAATLIKNLPPITDPSYPVQRKIAVDVAAVAFVGGADTTFSSVQVFFLMMAMHPDVVRQAQDEIDQVVGPDRLPTLDDQRSLPFIGAICKEVLRFHNVLPVAIPHMTSHDDEYRGYFIPKGALIIGNAWGILHDEDNFEKPLEFMPSRYMKDGELDHTVIDAVTGGMFGFGRRICPGRYMALNTLFLIVSNVLATFDITPPLGEDGKPKKLSYRMTNGLLSYPETFRCQVTPRSKRAEELIRGE